MEIETQTEEILFEMAASGHVSVSEEGGGGLGTPREEERTENEDTVEENAGGKHKFSLLEAVGVPVSVPSPKLTRRHSVRIMTPRKRLEQGGYAALDDNVDGAGDVEMLSTPGAGAPSNPVGNPMWKGEDEGEEGSA